MLPRQALLSGALEVISFGESAVADEGAGDGGEGQEVLSLAFVAAVQTATAAQPGHRALDRPAMPPQPGGGLDAFAGDAVSDASAGEPLAQVAVVVALVGVELAGLAAASAAA